MKSCKGNCGKRLNILDKDYCPECYKRLSLRNKFKEDVKRIKIHYPKYLLISKQEQNEM